MDILRFDALTRALATTRTRRGTVGAVLAGLLAPLGTAAAPESAACIHTGHICGKRRKRGGKKGGGKQRRRPSSRSCSKCCTRQATRTSNGTRRCSCKPEGTRCGNRTQCCSGRCQGGVCTSCTGGTTFCAGGCVNTDTDRDNCGECGHACATGEKCQTGTCVADCDVCAEGCDHDSVAAAVADAATGDTIRICPGTYPGPVRIFKSMTLIGAGAGETTLTGGRTATNQPVLHIRSGTVVVQALTVTGGNNTILDQGGGIGGGIGNDGTLTLAGVSVTGNTAEIFGGGIYNDGTLTLAGVSVTDNTGDQGGGIYNQGFLTLERNSSVETNTAEDGGGIYNNGTVLIDGSSVTENIASSGGGGGINSQSGSLTIIDGSTVEGNNAQQNGGGILNYLTTLTIDNSSVTGNTAGHNGGGIHNDAGGGIDATGVVTIDSGSSVTGNNADLTNPDSGGGIFNVPGERGIVNLASTTIVTGNNPDNCGGEPISGCVN